MAGGAEAEEEMTDVDKEEEAAGVARDLKMAETETETVTMIATNTKNEIETGALVADDLSDQAQLGDDIGVERCGTRDGSRTQAGCSVLVKATSR